MVGMTTRSGNADAMRVARWRILSVFVHSDVPTNDEACSDDHTKEKAGECKR